MNHTKKIITTLIMISATHAGAFDLIGTTFFSPRSQSTNAARDIVGWHRYINRYTEDLYGAFAATPSYGQILRASRAARVMFGTSTLTLSGSQVPIRCSDDFLADYFGLSPEFKSTVCLHPFIRTGLIDFGGYLGWHNFYVQIHAPVVWTSWKLGIQEEVEDNGKLIPFPANYMDAGAVTPPITSFAQAMRGGTTFGDVSEGMKYGKFGCAHHKTGLSDMQIALGYNVLQRETGHVGLNLRIYAPTGSRPNSEFLFEPIVGNGKHWEIGGGISGRALIWEKDGTQEWSFFVDANMMHICTTNQRRAFDFKINGMCSRYTLLKEFDDAGNYNGVCLPAINVTTLPCTVRATLQFDALVMFGYTYNEFVADIGYSAWVRTHEVICLREGLPRNRYGLKGIQNVTDVASININTTQSTANIHGDPLDEQAIWVDTNPPVFVNTCNLDLTSAASPLVLTQKVFGHLGYSWPHYCNTNVTPFLGIGGELEFEGINERGVRHGDKNTLSQWSMWLKGGVAY